MVLQHFFTDVRRPERGWLSGLVCAAIISLLILSSFFLIHEAAHECSTADCPICVCAQICERTIRQLGGGPSLNPFLNPFSVFILSSLCVFPIPRVFSTLVGQKVRMDD